MNINQWGKTKASRMDGREHLWRAWEDVRAGRPYDQQYADSLRPAHAHNYEQIRLIALALKFTGSKLVPWLDPERCPKAVEAQKLLAGKLNRIHREDLRSGFWPVGPGGWHHATP
jgi:hypothetical protein